MKTKKRQDYNLLARHFDIESLPPLLKQHLPKGPIAFADFGCGDGPYFSILQQMGYISASKLVYAVDLQKERLQRISDRYPFVTTIVASVESVPLIPDGTLDFVISTMVMEHVVNENRYLNELRRVLKPGGSVYLTTVFKRKWAWYFRRRDGQPVLDVSHLREYTDLASFEELLMKHNRFSTLKALELKPLWFPLLDPIIFRATNRGFSPSSSSLVRLFRLIKVPIPGYYSLNTVLQA